MTPLLPRPASHARARRRARLHGRRGADGDDGDGHRRRPPSSACRRRACTGNLDARKTDVANAIARTWVERLQRDAMQWTLPRLRRARRQQHRRERAASSQPGNVTGRVVPARSVHGTTTPETMSPGFDILGRDLPPAQLAPSPLRGGRARVLRERAAHVARRRRRCRPSRGSSAPTCACSGRAASRRRAGRGLLQRPPTRGLAESRDPRRPPTRDALLSHHLHDDDAQGEPGPMTAGAAARRREPASRSSS